MTTFLLLQFPIESLYCRLKRLLPTYAISYSHATILCVTLRRRRNTGISLPPFLAITHMLKQHFIIPLIYRPQLLARTKQDTLLTVQQNIEIFNVVSTCRSKIRASTYTYSFFLLRSEKVL